MSLIDCKWFHEIHDNLAHEQTVLMPDVDLGQYWVHCRHYRSEKALEDLDDFDLVIESCQISEEFDIIYGFDWLLAIWEVFLLDLVKDVDAILLVVIEIIV